MEELAKVAFVGSRDFPVLPVVKEVMQRVGRCIVVSGGARGVDITAFNAADELGYPKEILIPDWETHGKAAGPIRNSQMVELADAAIVFWDGKSRGSKDFMTKARKKKIPMVVFRCSGTPPTTDVKMYNMEMPDGEGQIEIAEAIAKRQLKLQSAKEHDSKGCPIGPSGAKKKGG